METMPNDAGSLIDAFYQERAADAAWGAKVALLHLEAMPAPALGKVAVLLQLAECKAVIARIEESTNQRKGI